MSNIAIHVENLSKLYQIGHIQKRDDTLRDALVHKLGRLSARKRNHTDQGNLNDEDKIWALKDVSFEVNHGEVLGIIGKNGAGKSTLLKILTQITEPTYGRAILDGRVGSLLEVGTGFHPELTGRENIFLNGVILGMGQREIQKKFDEIVDFSEIERFLDTPVKRYSSGMYVRLAFAVAAHLEPEILLVDEVLAVGDITFQKKCLGKMENLASQGRTVLFVSHNLAAISNLCPVGILLREGQLVKFGEINEVLKSYLEAMNTIGNVDLGHINTREGDHRVIFTDIRCFNEREDVINLVETGQNIFIELEYQAEKEIGLNDNVLVGIAFYNLLGRRLFQCRSDMLGRFYNNLGHKGSIRCRIPNFPLPLGEYKINLYLEINGQLADWVKDALILNVVLGDFYKVGYIAEQHDVEIFVDHDWLPARLEQ